MATLDEEPTERHSVTLQAPARELLLLIAAGLLVADVLLAAVGWGSRVHLVSLGLAVFVVAELLD